eukprot:762949-Hanusia_phi.AAC.4
MQRASRGKEEHAAINTQDWLDQAAPSVNPSEEFFFKVEEIEKEKQRGSARGGAEGGGGRSRKLPRTKSTRERSPALVSHPRLLPCLPAVSSPSTGVVHQLTAGGQLKKDKEKAAAREMEEAEDFAGVEMSDDDDDDDDDEGVGDAASLEVTTMCEW